jgi:hypothetical protein
MEDFQKTYHILRVTSMLRTELEREREESNKMSSSQEIARARNVWEALRRSLPEGSEETLVGTSQEVFLRQRETQLLEGEDEFVTPPQSSEQLAGNVVTTVNRHGPVEVQENLERHLAGRRSKQSIEEGREKNLLSWFETVSSSVVSRSPDPQQCLAVYK